MAWFWDARAQEASSLQGSVLGHKKDPDAGSRPDVRASTKPFRVITKTGVLIAQLQSGCSSEVIFLWLEVL